MKRHVSMLLVFTLIAALTVGVWTPTDVHAATNQDVIWTYFKNQGFTSAGTAGVMGNLEAESSYSPINLENTANNKSGMSDQEFTAAVDNGTISRDEFIASERFGAYSGGRYGYGLAQWTATSRKAGLYDFAKSRGVSIGNLTMQLDYIMQEINRSYGSLLPLLKSTNSVSEACLKFHNIYEGSADDASRIQGRINRAEAVYQKYDGSPLGPVSASYSTKSTLLSGVTGVKLETVVTMTNASISQLTSAGVVLFDSHDTEIGRKEEPVSYITSNMNIWYEVGAGKEINMTLNPGTVYKYMFFVRIGNDTYVDAVRSFTTSGSGVYLNVDGLLDGAASGTLGSCGTMDVYIKGKLVANDVNDYYISEHYGSNYEIRDVKAASGYVYEGVASGSLSGTIYGSSVNVVLKFNKAVSSVALDANGGSVSPTSITVTAGGTYGTLPVPTRSGYSFLGWYTQPSGGTRITSSTTVLSGVTKLYAHWEKISPLITSQPQNAVGKVGEKVTFSISASGVGLTYQWQYSTDGGKTWNASSSTGTTATCTLSAGRDGWLYRCIVRDSYGDSVISNRAKVGVLPSITAQPKSASGKVGDVLKFTVAASGDELTYKWQYSTDGGKTWKASSSTSTTATCTLSTADRDGWLYRCIVSSKSGAAVTSSTATVTVKPAITAQPKNAVGTLGQKVQFTISATGNGLTYKWQYSTDGGKTWKASSSTSKTATCTLSGAERNGWLYRCIVKDSHGATVTSSTAKVIIKTALKITSQPKYYIGSVGDVAKFTVKATGDGLKYKWQYSTDEGKTWKASSSTSATATCTLTSASRDGWIYRCIITDQYGESVISDYARVIIG